MYVLIDDMWQGIAPLYRRPGPEPGGGTTAGSARRVRGRRRATIRTAPADDAGVLRAGRAAHHMRQFLQRYYQRYHQLLADLFQQGFTRGEFHHGTAEAAAITLIGQLEGLGPPLGDRVRGGVAGRPSRVRGGSAAQGVDGCGYLAWLTDSGAGVSVAAEQGIRLNDRMYAPFSMAPSFETDTENASSDGSRSLVKGHSQHLHHERRDTLSRSSLFSILLLLTPLITTRTWSTGT
jgi:hypothetical protein